MEHTPQDKV